MVKQLYKNERTHIFDNQIEIEKLLLKSSGVSAVFTLQSNAPCCNAQKGKICTDSNPVFLVFNLLKWN